MSMPTFPETPDLTLEDSVIQIISSIAMEELALSHILNAEGEKLQFVLGTLQNGLTPLTPPTLEEVLEVNESVRDMLSTVSMNQMFLLGKMSAAMNAYSRMKDTTPGGGGGGGGGGEDPTGIEILIGRDLLGSAIGDTSDWIEVAKYNNAYSLIVRKNFINWYPNGHQGDASWQLNHFGSNDQYYGSTVRSRINAWFNGAPDGTADRLDETAPLRNFTVKNDARTALGTAAFVESRNNGFSKPLAEHDSNGDDVAFALSYGEAVNYISRLFSWGGGQSEASTAIAQANYERLMIPPTGNYSIWLRSPAGIVGGRHHAGVIATNPGDSFDGRVFREQVNREGLIYPATWVEEGIFAI